jgi:hypothetical protein
MKYENRLERSTVRITVAVHYRYRDDRLMADDHDGRRLRW